MRIVAKTAPMRQMEVGRELRARVKTVLDAAGVPPAGPDTIVITAPSDQGGSVAGPGSLAGPEAEGHTATELAVRQEDSTAEPAEDEGGAGPLREGAERGTP